MALTLPYPDMVFVPLDILTAAEQNQLVDNIEYIANQFPITAANIANATITNTQIASGTIQGSNVDWSSLSSANTDSMGGWYFEGMAQATTQTTSLTVPVTAGRNFYKIVWNAELVSGSWIDIRPLKNGVAYSGIKRNSVGIQEGATFNSIGLTGQPIQAANTSGDVMNTGFVISSKNASGDANFRAWTGYIGSGEAAMVTGSSMAVDGDDINQFTIVTGANMKTSAQIAVWSRD